MAQNSGGLSLFIVGVVIVIVLGFIVLPPSQGNVKQESPKQFTPNEYEERILNMSEEEREYEIRRIYNEHEYEIKRQEKEKEKKEKRRPRLE